MRRLASFPLLLFPQQTTELGASVEAVVAVTTVNLEVVLRIKGRFKLGLAALSSAP